MPVAPTVDPVNPVKWKQYVFVATARSPTKKVAEFDAPPFYVLIDVPVTGQGVAVNASPLFVFGKFAAVTSSIHCPAVPVMLKVEGNWTTTLATAGAVWLDLIQTVPDNRAVADCLSSLT